MLTGLQGRPRVWASCHGSTAPLGSEVQHHARRRWFPAGEYVDVRVGDPVGGQEPVTCVIPGHHQSGAERHGELLRVSDGPLSFELGGSCAYQSTFEYSSETPGRCRA